VCARWQQSGVRVGSAGHVSLRGQAAKILRDLSPSLPCSDLLSSSGVAATAMTVRQQYLPTHNAGYVSLRVGPAPRHALVTPVCMRAGSLVLLHAVAGGGICQTNGREPRELGSDRTWIPLFFLTRRRAPCTTTCATTACAEICVSNRSGSVLAGSRRASPPERC